MDQAAHVVLVSSPGLGNLIHFLELGHRISSVLNVHVTILAVNSSFLAETETIQAAKARGTCEIIEIPLVTVKESVRVELKSMKLKQTFMIVGRELMMSISDVGVTARYVYFPSHDLYREVMNSGLVTYMGDGILVNIWEEIQYNILASLRSDSHLNRIVKVPVYPIGPITKPKELFIMNENHNSIIEWLNNKRKRSVVFVCLESSDKRLSLEQKIEFALGLELSGKNFLWLSRSNDDDDLVSLDDGLPNGFLDPTRDVGRVVMGFESAPPAEILGHKSIGGFLSNCNGDILLESLTKGVPTITWPVLSRQMMNAMSIKKEVIRREDVALLVNKIVEDEEMRAKAEEMKVRFEQAWTPGGSSHISLLEWAKQSGLKVMT